MKVVVNQVYTAVACNRIPEIADWNSDGLICFGASNAVVIYNTGIKGSDPLITLSHHKLRVNTVKWLQKNGNTSCELLSGSADKTAAIWSFVDGTWRVTDSLCGHTDGVTCVHGVYINDTDLVIYTGSIDSTIRIWERKVGVLSHTQTINLNSGLCLTLHAHILPIVNKPILFCALDDHKIHVYAGQEFNKIHTLVGHEDWVRGLDVLDVGTDAILVASASQDTYIRLWRIQLHVNEETTADIKVELKVFNAYEHDWSVKLEAILAGHDGWVYGIQWHPYKYENGKRHPVNRLLSSSLDKTLIVWEPENDSHGDSQGVWVERVRVGEVGGNGLGFYGSRFGPDGSSFMGHGYNGSFHIWKLDNATNKWQPDVVCGGHFSCVEDVRWEPQRGRYIMSVSADQTTRVHAPWKRSDGYGTEWHEIARPQVHGYDMASLAPVSGVVFASAAEEKVIRVFRAPQNFITNFHNITGEVLAQINEGAEVEGASVPSLGLSNKAVFMADGNNPQDDDNDGYFVPINLTEPPTEETLMQNTLWPESHKLYGHGYEVFALDASPDGQLLASACRATTAEHAAVIIWETKSWKQIQSIASHRLTITQLAFSPDSHRLLSVSRDRKWTLYHRQQGSNQFTVAAATDKSTEVHSRIIWTCAWAHDGAIFGTGSREGKICLWSETGTRTESSLNGYALLSQHSESKAVTALAFAPIQAEDSRIIAAGLEDGLIRIYSFSSSLEWVLLKEMDKCAAHHLTVKRLTFKPAQESDTKTLLASCGDDHLVRIHSIVIT